MEYLPVSVARQPSARVIAGRNKLHHAMEVLRDVLSGERGFDEAAVEHGDPRRGGQSLRFARFADYLRDPIADAEHPDREWKVLA